MRRGDIYLVRDPGSVASKSRPCLIVQTDTALPPVTFVTVCALTSTLGGLDLIRVAIEPDEENGLKRRSEVEVDLVDTVRVANVGARLGRVTPAIMRRVDVALRRWLDL